ncbi:MAG: hypothetical protein IJ706_06105 [Clostridia bacterium]|nr:hypothetical protein [Clostridia bacterium]
MKLPYHLLSKNLIKAKGITDETPFEIVDIDAYELLVPERFDLTVKLAYIEARESGGDMKFAKEMYAKHIEAFSEGYFVEPGNNFKNSLERFFSVFHDLIDDFKQNGFDSSKSLIPVGKDNIILDGAHRTACAIYFKKKVSIIRFNELEVNFDYKFFRQRKMAEEMLEYMSIIFCRYSINNIYLACFWPTADLSKRDKALNLIEENYKIIFNSEYSLSRNGLRNFMIQIYQQQDWIGSFEDHFKGVMGKVDACFIPQNTTETTLFLGGSLDKVLSLKDDIREIFKIGKHSVHISDTNNETLLMAELLFNYNSVHALNYGEIDKYPNIFNEIKKANATGLYFNYNATIGYYGISSFENILDNKMYYDNYNPRTYFVYAGLKLPAITEIKGITDKVITKRIKHLIKLSKNNYLKRKIESYKVKIFWSSKKVNLKIKQIAMKIAKKFGLYDVLHKLTHR